MHTQDAHSGAPGVKEFRRHSRLMVVVGAVIAIALGAAYLSIGHDPQPRDVPIAAVGTPAVAKAIEAKAPGQLDVRAVHVRHGEDDVGGDHEDVEPGVRRAERERRDRKSVV